MINPYIASWIDVPELSDDEVEAIRDDLEMFIDVGGSMSFSEWSELPVPIRRLYYEAFVDRQAGMIQAARLPKTMADLRASAERIVS